MKQEVYAKYKSASNEKILYEFQKQALNASEPNYFYALDTGTGKTITSIHHYLKWSNGERLVIFCPPAKKKEGGWDRDIQFIEKAYDIKINYEVVSYGTIARYIKPNEPYFIIYDEAHYLKNPTSKRGKKGALLAKGATNFCLLTATPMANGWIDSYNYFIMFNFFRNKTQMNREHAIYEARNFTGRPIQVVAGFHSTEILDAHFASFSVSISKDEALDLPPLIFEQVKFEASKEYRTLKKDRVLGDVAYDTMPKLLHGLRFYANQSDKLSYTEMMMEGTSKNIVIFYQYKYEFEKLHEISKKLKKKIFVVNGQKNSLPAKASGDKLKNSVTLIQYQAGSSGIELQYCSEVIFYTPTYSYQDYEQSLGRAYRNGQTNKVTVYQYMTDKTIETDVWQALANKKDFSEDIYMKTNLGVK